MKNLGLNGNLILQLTNWEFRGLKRQLAVFNIVASTSDKEIKRKRPNDKFIRQIKRIAKQLDWRAG